MCPSSEVQEKMDVLDLIINILKEHEENLEKLADKFGSALNNLESKISNLNEAFAQLLFSKTSNPENMKPAALAQCKEWTEFRAKSAGAHIVAFKVEEKVFTVNSLLSDVVYRYSEPLPELKFQVEEGEKRYVVKKMAFDSPGDLFLVFKGRLKCGLEVFVKGSKFDLFDNERLLQLTYCVDPARAKHWLSEELSVPKENII